MMSCATLHDSGKWACCICLLGVGSNSSFLFWLYWLGLWGTVAFVVTLLRMLALGVVDVALVNNHKIEVVDSFCYLGDFFFFFCLQQLLDLELLGVILLNYFSYWWTIRCLVALKAMFTTLAFIVSWPILMNLRVCMLRSHVWYERIIL